MLFFEWFVEGANILDMEKPLRLSFENAVYHVTARGNRRENIFYSDKDKSIFLEKMNEIFEKHSFICYVYCLIDNHYRLNKVWKIINHKS